MPGSGGEYYKTTDVRWICWPVSVVDKRCISGLCSQCDKPPYRKTITYKDLKHLAATLGCNAGDVNQGMLFRPVRKINSRR